jgi:hypothetical protein
MVKHGRRISKVGSKDCKLGSGKTQKYQKRFPTVYSGTKGGGYSNGI